MSRVDLVKETRPGAAEVDPEEEYRVRMKY